MESARLQNVLLVKELRALAAFDAMEGWRACGAKSTAQWLKQKSKCDPGTAREQVLVARCLAAHDDLAEYCASGTVSWDALLRVTRTLAREKAHRQPDFGASYRFANEWVSITEGRSRVSDANAQESAARRHAHLQNVLALALLEAGLEPRSPSSTEPDFDIAWNDKGIRFVAEVKSLTCDNESTQLRLALGQVLWYRHVLSDHGPSAAVVMLERAPLDSRWPALFAEQGVHVIWPEAIHDWLARLRNS